MQGKYIKRRLEAELEDCLKDFPAVAVLGPRQCGKSTLAKAFIEKFDNALYLDLENPADLAKLHDPELFFAHHQNKLVCLDEIQLMPEIFARLRSIIDAQNRNGQFIFLGSASRDLIKQSSETLAGGTGKINLNCIFLEPFRSKFTDDLTTESAPHRSMDISNRETDLHRFSPVQGRA